MTSNKKRRSRKLTVVRRSRQRQRNSFLGEQGMQRGRYELKYVDAVFAAAIPAAGLVQSLNSIGAGTDYNQRIGRHIRLKQLEVDFTITGPTVAASTFDHCFVAIVYDRQPTGALPTTADIFDLAVFPPGFGFMNNKVYMDRFRLLHYTPATVNLQAGPNERHRFAVTPPQKLVDVEYGSAAVTVPTTGALYLVSLSYNNTGLPATSATLIFNSRFVFEDA